MSYTRTVASLQAATIAGLLFFGGVAFAQDASTGAVTPAPTPTTDRKTEVKEKTGKVRAEKKERMNAEKRARLEGVVRKLNRHIKNLEVLLARTESRIAKLAAQGGNTTTSAAFVTTVKTKIAEAKAAIEDLKVKAQAAASSETKEKITEITAGARSVEAKIKEARAALSDAINSLKPGRNAAKPVQ